MLSPIRCTYSYYPLKFRTAVVRVSRRSRHKQNSIGSIVISHACICILVIFCCVPIHGKECQYRMNALCVSQSSAIIGITNLQYFLSKPTGRNYIFKTNASCMKTSVFFIPAVRAVIFLITYVRFRWYSFMLNQNGTLEPSLTIYGMHISKLSLLTVPSPFSYRFSVADSCLIGLPSPLKSWFVSNFHYRGHSDTIVAIG